MAKVPNDTTVRQAMRSKSLAEAALAAPAGQQVALKILAPGMKSASEQFIASDTLVTTLARSMSKEGDESKTAIAELHGCYNEFLPVAQTKCGFTGSAASSFSTDTDLFAGAEGMEVCFEEQQDQDWAKSALAQLSPVMDKAAKESTEYIEIDRELQKAKATRSLRADEFRAELLPFRRTVRATFGSASHEYRDLCDPQRRKQGTPPAGEGGEATS